MISATSCNWLTSLAGPAFIRCDQVHQSVVGVCVLGQDRERAHGKEKLAGCVSAGSRGIRWTAGRRRHLEFQPGFDGALVKRYSRVRLHLEEKTGTEMHLVVALTVAEK